MGFLLDANAVIALLNDLDSQLAQRVRLLRPAEIFISSIVVQELFYGAFKMHALRTQCQPDRSSTVRSAGF